MNDISESNKRQWQEFFQGYSEDWDKLYKGMDYDSYAKQQRAKYAIHFIEKYIPSGRRILDVGCGTGWISCVLAQKGYEVTGVDFSENMIELANKNARQMGVESRCHFLLGEMDKLKLKENRYDAIIALGYLEYILQPKPIMNEMYRLLAPSGIVVAQIWNRVRMVHLLNFMEGPARMLNPHALYLKILNWLQASCKHEAGHSPSSKTEQPVLLRKWYTPWMLDRTMLRAGFLKHEHMGHVFAGFRYGNKLILPDKIAIALENGCVRLSRRGLFKRMQLLGENYIGVYYRPR